MRAWLPVVVLIACHHAKQVSLAPLPRVAYAHYLEGKLALFRGEADTAARELELAHEAAPQQPMISVELAKALVRAKRLPEARTVLAKARSEWPDHAQVWLASGDVLAGEAPQEAAHAYRRAIELAPDDERSYLGLAKIEEPRDAEKTLRKLVARVPASVDGHYRLAQRFALRGEMAFAIGELRAVLERDPDHIDGRLDLARALRRTGNLPEAIAQTRSAFDRAGQPMDVAEELFYLLCEADDKQGAIDLLTLLDDERSDVDLLALVARLNLGLGRIDEAAQLATRISALDVEVGRIVAVEIDSARRDPAAAIQHARGAAKPEARRLAADAALYAGQAAQALAIAPEGSIEMAFALADLGRASEATPIVAKLDVYGQARYADHAHDSARAVSLLEGILREKPDVAAALNLAGYLLADGKQRLPDAEKYLKRARDILPGEPAVLDSWGWLLYNQGRAKEAVRALDHAARFAPLEPEILVHLAAAQLADKNAKVAADLLSRADALRPSPEVARKIVALRATMRP